jgi:hypothetical protein
LHPTMQRRRGHHSVCCSVCLCHGRDYTRAFSPTGFENRHPSIFSAKYLKLREKQFLHSTSLNNELPPNPVHPNCVADV